MARKVEPQNLITIGIFGAAFFALVAVAGLVWQMAAHSGHGPVSFRDQPPARVASQAASVEPAPPPPPPQPPAVTPAEPPRPAVDLVTYINGPLTDLIFEFERARKDLDSDAVKDDDTRRVVIQRLQSLRRRTQAAMSNVDLLLKLDHPGDPALALDRSVAMALDASLDELTTLLQAPPPEPDQQARRDLSNRAARARFLVAVGALSSWVVDARATLAAQ
jgi:hypothetical protein